jgi:hypothetical protein
MKKLLAVGVLSLAALGLAVAPASAWFHDCCGCGCGLFGCCHRCCSVICCRQYNAFSPCCCGSLCCMGCCPFGPCGWGGYGGYGCGPAPYSPGPDCYGPSCGGDYHGGELPPPGAIVKAAPTTTEAPTTPKSPPASLHAPTPTDNTALPLTPTTQVWPNPMRSSILAAGFSPGYYGQQYAPYQTGYYPPQSAGYGYSPQYGANPYGYAPGSYAGYSLPQMPIGSPPGGHFINAFGGN